ncbi:hypothetical protein PHET_04997 [Paragonimus heterotremus]|uniref:Cysteine/serine-rich nuclear protein N-terminal domain-containing protein n=1 Tax=Paragonimus heterotremus TaxID=100268 RepID=A0A8J4WI74_9TREM|nr:hypothetical protein PHET_04997 [Paragonimus heterotremus]
MSGIIEESPRSPQAHPASKTVVSSSDVVPRKCVCSVVDNGLNQLHERETPGVVGNAKCVQFSGVVVYSFAREQGFSSIPDTGWCSLGMARHHFSVSRYDLHHHQILIRLRRRRRRMLSHNSRVVLNRNNFGKSILSHGLRTKRITNPSAFCDETRMSPGDSCRVPNFPSPPPLSPQLVPERSAFPEFSSPLTGGTSCNAQATPPPPCLSPPSPRRVLANLEDSLINSNVTSYPESFDTDSEASLDHIPTVHNLKTVRSSRSRGKLLPIHASARIRMLKESGVTRLDESEREVCLSVRATRSRIGCDCGPRYPCTPGRCSCIEDGVQCQVDKAAFPCSCLAASCHNPSGRTEFSHEQVRAYVHNVLHRVNGEYSSTATSSHSASPQLSIKTPTTLSESSSHTDFAESSLCGNKACSPSRRVKFTPPLKPRKGAFRLSSGQPTCDKQIKSSLPLPSSGSTQSFSGCNQIDGRSSPALFASTPTTLDPPVCRVLFHEAEPALPMTCGPNFEHSSTSFINNIDQAPTPERHTGSIVEPPTSTLNHSLSATALSVHSLNKSQFVGLEQNFCPLIATELLNEPYEVSLSVTDSQLITNGHVPSECDRIANPNSQARLDETDQLPATLTRKQSELAHSVSDCLSCTNLRNDGLRIIAPPSPDSFCDISLTSGVFCDPVHLAFNDNLARRNSHQCESAPSLSPKLPNKLCTPTDYASYRLAGTNLISRSAPNSPCSDTPSSLSRLSLRRRAIPRLPVTPSRRMPRSPRLLHFSSAMLKRKLPQSNLVEQNVNVACRSSGVQSPLTRAVRSPTHLENSGL